MRLFDKTVENKTVEMKNVRAFHSEFLSCRFLSGGHNRFKCTTFIRCDFSKGHFWDSEFKGCRFIECNLEDTEFTSCTFAKNEFSGCGFYRMNLLNSRIDTRLFGETKEATSYLKVRRGEKQYLVTLFGLADLLSNGQYRYKDATITEIKEADTGRKTEAVPKDGGLQEYEEYKVGDVLKGPKKCWVHPWYRMYHNSIQGYADVEVAKNQQFPESVIFGVRKIEREEEK